MRHVLQRHPLPVRAYFRHSLVLTYALSRDVLTPLLPPGLELDEYDGLGFVAVAMVQTRRLRPAFLPEAFGCDFCLAGYRVFTRHRLRNGASLRGLRILRSDADRRMMVAMGNLLTHYNYRLARIDVREDGSKLWIDIRTTRGEADLSLIADLASRPARLPPGSPFRSERDARRYAGPLPYTFDYESQTHSIIRIGATREYWEPQPIGVEVRTCTFFDQLPFAGTTPVLANAFHVANVPYTWKRGVRERLATEGAA